MSKLFFVVIVLLAIQAWHLEARIDLEGKTSSLISSRAGGDCYNYAEITKWSKCDPRCAYETNQVAGSPINIPTSGNDAQIFKLSTPDGENLKHSSYRNKYTTGSLAGKWARKGFTLQFTIDDSVADGDLPKIRYKNGGDLTGDDTDDYKLWQIHYHWGKDNDEGSEHTIDSSQAPLEAHFVHVNTAASDTSSDWLLVIGVLFEAVNTEDIETNWQKWPAGIARNIARQELMSSKSPLGDGTIGVDGEPITVPKNTHWNLYNTLTTALEDGHYAYKGSLTTPGCNEQVTWIVGKHKVKVFGDHLDNFRKLINPGTGELIRRNWRPTQDIGDRTVYEMPTSWDP